MGAHVVGLGDDFQVRRAVVQFVSVDVVDPLIGPQRATKHLRDNDAVLKLVSAANPDASVAVVVDVGTAAPSARVFAGRVIGTGTRAVSSSRPAPQLPLLPSELRPASLADEDAIGTADTLHCERLYHFDEEAEQIRQMFAQVLP